MIIHGLKNAKLKHLNGLTGLVVAHRSEGHPSFVTKTCEVGSLAMPTLVVCVQFNEGAGQKSVMLEPRFLVSSAELQEEAAEHMLRIVKSLSDSADACGVSCQVIDATH